MSQIVFSFFLSILIIKTTLANIYDDESNDTNGAHLRIIGGVEVTNTGAYPWFVTAKDLRCGGCLISSRHVLTAAHCKRYFVSPVTVGYLCDEDNNCGQHSEVIDIARRHTHPNHTWPSLDLMIVELQNESTISPIPVDQDSSSLNYTPEKVLWAAGTGLTKEGDISSLPSQLREVDVKYVSQTECNKRYDGDIDESMICAADVGKDSCQGDSGGPLLDKENGVLVGVSSWGTGCADQRYPGVYARVSGQWPWIKKTVCDDYADDINRPDFCDRIEKESCVDSPLMFRKSNMKFRKCGWVNKNKLVRCNIAGVKFHCPNTCDSCSAASCSDTTVRFKRGNNLRSCLWVANTKTAIRCGIKGVRDTCRKTCGCPSPSPKVSYTSSTILPSPTSLTRDIATSNKSYTSASATHLSPKLPQGANENTASVSAGWLQESSALQLISLAILLIIYLS